jgi:glycosyltransferase involved in cell wall biosynthesis
MSLNNLLSSDRSTWPPFLVDIKGNFTSDDINLSIVIPSFNAVNFISETLVRVREISNAQILVLDDGSTDQTTEIATQLLVNHPNYSIFKLTHKGAPGQARNFGASVATGKWIWFLDCDDLPMNSNLKELFEAGEELSSDMLILRYLVRYDSRKQWVSAFDDELFSRLTESNYNVFPDWFHEPKLIRLSPHPSRIIYSRNYILNNNLKFDVDETFEDGSFWPRAMIQAKNVITWNWPELVYRVRQGSITHSSDLGRKLFLLSQLQSIFQDPKFCKVTNSPLWGSTYMYGLEMISWPLSSLRSDLRRQYKQKSKDTLNNLGSKWFCKAGGISFADRKSISKTLIRFGCFKLSLLCLLGAIK